MRQDNLSMGDLPWRQKIRSQLKTLMKSRFQRRDIQLLGTLDSSPDLEGKVKFARRKCDVWTAGYFLRVSTKGRPRKG